MSNSTAFYLWNLISFMQPSTVALQIKSSVQYEIEQSFQDFSYIKNNSIVANIYLKFNNIVPTQLKIEYCTQANTFSSYTSSSSFSMSSLGKIASPFFTCSPLIISNVRASSQATAAYHRPSCFLILSEVVCMNG